MPSWLSSQIIIINTVFTPSVSQPTGDVTQVLQADIIFALTPMKEPGGSPTLSIAALQKIKVQVSPTYFDRLKQHKPYNTN